MNPASMTNVERAMACWGSPPEWILTLARECDATNQKIVGDRLGRSGGYVSRILRNQYLGSMVEAERLVSAALASDRVACPAFGDLSLTRCIRLRRPKGPPANNIERWAAGACPTCPINDDKGARK